MDFFNSKDEVNRLEPLIIPKISLAVKPLDCFDEQKRSDMGVYYCPLVSDLYLDGTTWRGPGKWKSYQVSFIKSVNKFLGAQWNGINIGRTVCLYGGDDNSDFPVELVFPALTNKPELPIWGEIDKNNTSNCISDSSNVCNCPIVLFSQSSSPSGSREAIDNLSLY